MTGITPVTPVVEMLIGGTWTDITADVQLGDAEGGGGIRIKRGVPNEGAQAEPTEVQFTLNNAAGKYSPRNEQGVNYGRLGRNTPVRVALSRLTETFAHAETDTWGRLPSWTDSENATQLGPVWRINGTATRFDIAGGFGTIASTTGTNMATFGTYGDVEVLAKVRTSVRDSEFGVILRNRDPLVFAADFESGAGGWTTTGTTTPFALSTAIVHSGTTCGSMVVSGSPTNAHLRSEAVPGTTKVTPGRAYRARAWLRCTAAQAASFVVNWYDASGTIISPSSTTSFTFTANTWAVFEVSGVAPDNAVTALIGPTLTGSPANGTVLLIDDVDFMATDWLDYYTAYVTPGGSDVIRLGRISRNGASLLNTTVLPANIVVGTDYWIKAQLTGIRRRAKIWKDGDPEPDWQVWHAETGLATKAVSMPQYGQVGLFAKDGTSTVSFDSAQVTVWRAHAEVTELPPRWDMSRYVHWVPIMAKGILRRLGQGRKPSDSPMTLYLKSYSATARSWSPLESFDPNDTTVPNLITNGALPFARHLSNGTPDTSGPFALPGISGFADFDQDDSFLSVKTLPGATPGKWSYFNVWRMPSAPASDVLLYSVNSSGTATLWKIYLQLDKQIRVEAYNSLGTQLASSVALAWFGNTEIPDGAWLAANLYVFDSGGTVSWAWNYHRPGGSSFYTINGTFSGSAGTWGATTYQSSAVHTAAGHLMVAQAFGYPGDLPFVTDAFARAAYGYIGEDAITRWQRVAANAGIKTALTADPGLTAMDMGPQPPGKTLDVMQECVEVDDSIMMEQRDDFGLNYRSRVSLYNQTPVSVSIDSGHLVSPLEPTDDDQQVRNDVTVKRTNGGSARSVQTSGPLNVNEPEDDLQGVGTYDSAPEMNYYVDSQLSPAANWGRSKGTIDEPRYPSIAVDYNAFAYDNDPGLLAAMLALDSGDIMSVLNTEVSYNPTKQLVVAYEEKIDQYEYGVTFTTKPGSIYDVGVVGINTRVATKYATVQASFVSGTNTDLKSTITAPGALWVTPATDANSFPFDVMVSGVRLRVRSVGKVLNANPYFDNDITGWDPVGTTTLYHEKRLGFGRTWGNPCIRCTSTSAAADTGCQSSAASQAAVTPGETVRISAWIKPEVTTTIACQGIFYDASSVFLTGVTPTIITATGGVWTHYWADIVVPASAAFMRIRAAAFLLNAGQSSWIDDVRMMKPATYASSPQTLQVDQAPVYGVIKTLNPGAPITVADPWRVAF